MRAIGRKILAILIITSLLVCSGCSGTTGGKMPSNYEQLYPLIGKPITEACKALGLDEAEVLEANRNKQDYRLPGTVEYAGITWNVVLSFDWGHEVVLAFRYVKQYDNDTGGKQFMQDAMKLGAHLKKHYGESANLGGDSLVNLSKEELQEKITERQKEAGSYYQTETWYQNDQITDAMRAFHEEYLKSYPGERVPEYPLYVMNLSYGASSDGTAALYLEYRFRASIVNEG